MYVLFYHGDAYKAKQLREIKEFLTNDELKLNRNLETELSTVWVEKQDGRACKAIPYLPR